MDNFNLLYEFLLVCGIVVTLIILLLLGKKKSKYLHDQLLFVFFVLVFLLFLNHYAGHHQIYWLFISTTIITNGIGFLIGPLIYWYIQSLFTEVNFKTSCVWFPFLPFVFYALCFTIPLCFSNPTDGLLFPYLHFYFDYPNLIYSVEILYLLFFTIGSLISIERFTSAIKAYYSNLTKADILWSKRLLLSVILYLVIDIGLTIFETQIAKFTPLYYFLNVWTILMVVLYLGYYGFFQSQLLLPSFLLEKPHLPKLDNNKKKKPKPSNSFSTEEITQIKIALNNVLEHEKLYLNEALTLSDLAVAVLLTDKKLSTFINQVLLTNFYELINRYRITEFKAEIALPENQNLTIWGIASQCGFNSKTSFNRIFKKQTGLTPSQYQKILGE